MTKFKLYLDKDKETAWLNAMAAQGHVLTNFRAGFYSFESCRPGEYIYQIDITPGLFKITDDYREFMEEMGVEIVCCWGYWVILRKKAADGDFRLYTDVESTISHYKKIRNMFKVCTILEIICFMFITFSFLQGVSAAFSGMVIIGFIILALTQITFKTNGIIQKLQEEAGKPARRGMKNPNKSLLLGIALNLLSVNLLHSVHPVLHGAVQSAAIVLMLVGAVQVSRTSKMDVEK